MLRFKYLVLFIVSAVFVATLTLVAAPDAEAAEVKLNIVALGDSYTSGTGGLGYFGTSGCYKSHNNYAEQLAERIDGEISVDYVNLACHGAWVNDVYSQLTALSDRQKIAVDLVLLTIGGNDAGFANIVKQCLVDLTNSYHGCISSLENAAEQSDAIISRTQSLLLHLSNQLPNAKIVLVGYPNIIDDGPGNCDYIVSLPGVEFHAGDAILQLAYQSEADQLNLVDVLKRAQPGRFEFSSLKALFNGHEQCGDKDLWIRGNYDTQRVY